MQIKTQGRLKKYNTGVKRGPSFPDDFYIQKAPENEISRRLCYSFIC
jgi:hypothetical protein